MFERYTEKARRVIFFARYEASQLGQPNIETEHILLGIMREDRRLVNRFLPMQDPVVSIRKQIENQTGVREKVSTSVDLPLSNECKRVLAYGAEEAERLANKFIGSEHLLLGLLREEQCFAAAMLMERGLELKKVRDELARTPHGQASEPGVPPPSLAIDVRDLVLAASNGELEPVVGREPEIEAVMEILLSRHKANAMLVGERGCGKTALVEGLAQRIAGGDAPPWFSERRLLAIDPEALVDRSGERAKAQDDEARAGAIRLLETLLERLVVAANKSAVVLFLDDLCDVLTAKRNAAQSQFGLLLKTCMQREQVQCIASATPDRWRKAVEAAPWLEQYFRPVAVSTMDAEQALAVLQARRQVYEKHHRVAIDEAALECAARSAGRYLPDSVLPGKALNLIDAAAARMNLGAERLPDAVREVKRRLQFIEKRLADAIANHEFEKATFYEREESKEKENLRAAEEKHGPTLDPKKTIGVAEIEAVIARWGGYPYRAE